MKALLLWVLARIVPTGAMLDYGAATAPNGAWLLCDGTSYSTTTYANLFAVIGYAYGGSGANFNVPDFRGRVAAGFAASGGHTDVSTLGNNDGVAVANRRPKHNHTVSTQSAVNTNPGDLGATGGHTDAAGNTNNAGGAEFSHTHTVGPGGTAPVDAPGYLVANKIIKT